MSGFEQWLPSHDAPTIMFTLLIFAAGIVAALVFRDAGMRGTTDLFLRAVGLVVVGVLAWTWFNVSAAREQAAERRALDARMTELSAQAMAPGSALSCLDGTGLEAVDAACGQALFASSQTVAAAVVYTNARLSLLEDGLSYAARDKSYAPVVDRLRRVLAADHYGVVAHVLAARGCTVDECPAFALFSDASKLMANLKDRSFEASVTHYAANWRSEGANSATAAVPSNDTPAPIPPSAALTPGQTLAPTGIPLNPKYSLPSSASIPPVSIMANEPAGPEPPAATGTATAQPKRQAVKRVPAKQQSALPPPPPGTISNPAPPAGQ